METINYEISKHASERYALRIMGKDNNTDIKRFIVDNEDKIKTDINKLIAYGKLIYAGKQQRDGKTVFIDVFLKDTWVVLADSRTKKVITLYKIDLGLGDDFNKAYVSGMEDKINTYKDILANVQKEVQIETEKYKQLLEDTESQIKEYRSAIKNLEELCEGYKIIINNNNVKVLQANKDLADVINTFIEKREF